MLHLDNRKIIVGVGHKHDVIEVIAHDRATAEDDLASLQQVDDFVQSSAACHTLPPVSLRLAAMMVHPRGRYPAYLSLLLEAPTTGSPGPRAQTRQAFPGGGHAHTARSLPVPTPAWPG